MYNGILILILLINYLLCDVKVILLNLFISVNKKLSIVS